MTNQQRDALARANAVRAARANLKRGVFDGRVDVRSIIEEPPPDALQMSVMSLLCARRYWSEKRSRRLLARTMIPPHRTLAALTERQRAALVGELDQRP
jgi:hypothetical protein